MAVTEIPGHTILRELGRGGTAVVYLALQEQLKREVAVKVLRPPDNDDGSITERFLNEARTIGRLQHPHIVSIFDFGETEDGGLFYTMPNLPGGLANFAYESDAQLSQTLLQVCDGLSFAHRQGIVHRDIKPENLLLDQRGYVQIADFGIAFSTRSAATRVTREGHTIGSSHHMSPEQARGNPVDPRSDVYSLGVVLFEMLAGRPPFEGPDDVSVLVAHVADPVPKLPGQHRHWQSVVDRALQKKPQDRYQTVEAMARAIRSVGSGNRQPDGPLVAKTTFSRRTASWAGLAICIALVWFLWSGREEPARPADNTASESAAQPEMTSRTSADQVGTASDPSEAPPEPAETMAASSAVQEPVETSSDPVGLPVQDAPQTTIPTVSKHWSPGDKLSDAAGIDTFYVPREVTGENGAVSEVNTAFAMAVHEVTVEQYREFTQATRRPGSKCVQLDGISLRRKSWYAPGFVQSDDHPVACVSHQDAVDFAAWLSQRSGHRYLLPSASQWRHAAWIGHVSNIACETSNVAGRERQRLFAGSNFTCRDGHRFTAPVTSFNANRLGIFDLKGNLSEWTTDCAENPPEGVESCALRMVRGTSWKDGRDRSMLDHAELLAAERGYTTVGIRLIRELSQAD